MEWKDSISRGTVAALFGIAAVPATGCEVRGIGCLVDVVRCPYDVLEYDWGTHQLRQSSLLEDLRRCINRGARFSSRHGCDRTLL